MIELLSWFQTNYPHLQKALQECTHHFDNQNLNPYHIEGDCWSHTLLVCKVAELREYDIVVKVSALLHDIGKPKARRVNSKNNHVRFFGHEKISADMSKPLVKDLESRGVLTKDEGETVLELVASHSYLYKHTKEEIYQKFKDNRTLFNYLLQLGECDNLGRFSNSMRESEDNYNSLKDIFD